MDFDHRLKKWSQEAVANAMEIQKAACKEMARLVIQDTPVKTGRARANWRAGINQAPTGTVELFDISGQDTLAEVQRVLDKIKPGDTFTLVNNLDYANELEDGSSRQAPNGMLKKNLARWPELVEQAASKGGKS